MPEQRSGQPLDDELRRYLAAVTSEPAPPGLEYRAVEAALERRSPRRLRAVLSLAATLVAAAAAVLIGLAVHRAAGTPNGGTAGQPPATAVHLGGAANGTLSSVVVVCNTQAPAAVSTGQKVPASRYAATALGRIGATQYLVAVAAGGPGAAAARLTVIADPALTQGYVPAAGGAEWQTDSGVTVTTGGAVHVDATALPVSGNTRPAMAVSAVINCEQPTGQLTLSQYGIGITIPLTAPIADSTLQHLQGAFTETGISGGSISVAGTFAVSTAAIDRAGTCGETTQNGGIAIIEIDASDPTGVAIASGPPFYIKVGRYWVSLSPAQQACSDATVLADLQLLALAVDGARTAG